MSKRLTIILAGYVLTCMLIASTMADIKANLGTYNTIATLTTGAMK